MLVNWQFYRASLQSLKIPVKTDLIREGDRPGQVFIMLEGWVCRHKIFLNGTRQKLAYLMPGDCSDLHIGLLAGMDHSIQVITPTGRNRRPVVYGQYHGEASRHHLGFIHRSARRRGNAESVDHEHGPVNKLGTRRAFDARTRPACSEFGSGVRA